MGAKQYDECRVFLESYKELRVEEDRLADTIRRLWEQNTRITARYSGMPGGGGGESFDSGNVAMGDAIDRANARYNLMQVRKEEITEFIDGVEGDLNRSILRLRYLRMMTWEEISRALSKAGYKLYEERQLRRLHGHALNAARKHWIDWRREWVNWLV